MVWFGDRFQRFPGNSQQGDALPIHRVYESLQQDQHAQDLASTVDSHTLEKVLSTHPLLQRDVCDAGEVAKRGGGRLQHWQPRAKVPKKDRLSPW